MGAEHNVFVVPSHVCECSQGRCGCAKHGVGSDPAQLLGAEKCLELGESCSSLLICS